MASHVSTCMAHIEGYKYGIKFNSRAVQFVGAARRRRRNGKEVGRKGEEKGRKRKEKDRRKRMKRGKRKRKRKECRAVRRPRLQRTRNCTTRGRFPLTLVILRLGAVYWPMSFVWFSERICMLCSLFVIV